MLRAEVRYDAVQAFQRPFDAGLQSSPLTLEALATQDGAALGDGRGAQTLELNFAADLRYLGQEYFLTVPIEARRATAELADRFHQLYFDRYGHSDPSQEIEFVALRASGSLRVIERGAAAPAAVVEAEPPPPHGHGRVWFNGVFHDAPIVTRATLGEMLEGPAILVDTTGTTVLPPAWGMRLLDEGHVVMEAR
jgi:N-methylhydantoinase A